MSLFPSETTTMNSTAYCTRWWIRQRFITKLTQDYSSTYPISYMICVCPVLWSNDHHKGAVLSLGTGGGGYLNKWTISNKYFQIFLHFGLIYNQFKPFLNSRKSCFKTLGLNFYPFSSIKNLQLKKRAFFFLLPIRIQIMNQLKWIFSNIFCILDWYIANLSLF